MKIGDTFPVTVEGLVVATATVQEIEGDRATIVIPGTQFVAGIKSNLVDTEREVETDRIMSDEVHRETKDEPSDAVREANESIADESINNKELDSSAID